jgi:hypothetical protein
MCPPECRASLLLFGLLLWKLERQVPENLSDQRATGDRSCTCDRMALACAEARAADFSDAASDQQYIDAPNGSAISFDRERQRVISRERLDAIRESRMVGLPSCGMQLGRSALFVDDLDPLVDHFAGEPVGLVQDVPEINLRNVGVQA